MVAVPAAAMVKVVVGVACFIQLFPLGSNNFSWNDSVTAIIHLKVLHGERSDSEISSSRHNRGSGKGGPFFPCNFSSAPQKKAIIITNVQVMINSSSLHFHKPA